MHQPGPRPDRQHPTIVVAHPSADLYGSDRVLLESVSALVDGGFRVLVTVPDDGPLVPFLRERGADVVVSPSPVLRKSYLNPRGLLRLAGLSLTSFRDSSRIVSAERPAAIFVNTITIPLWLVVARVRRVPVVCHVHEAEGSASLAMRRLLALPLLLADSLVVNSRFSQQVLAGSFARLGRRSSVVYNGVVGPSEVTEPRAELTAPVRVVYVGRLSHRKGVDVVVEAVGALTAAGVDVTLDVVGAVFPGYEWYEADLREQARRLGIEDAVRFRGFVPRVWDLVSAGDVVVVPSRLDEPFGNTVVEALLCARPVIASATSGLLEASAGYAAARTVPPGDATALAAAIQGVIADWDVLRPAAVADAALAEERHSPSRYRAQILAAVSQLVRRRGRSASPTAGTTA